MKKDKSSYTSYEVITQEADNGDLLVPLPPALLKALDWKEGDVLDINFDDNGNIVFKKADK